MNIRQATLEILRRVRARISDPKAWMQDGLAKDVYGGSVAPISPRACRWCLTGALDMELYQVPVEDRRMIAEGAVDMLRRQMLSTTSYVLLASFNDCSPHADVLALIDRTLSANKNTN